MSDFYRLEACVVCDVVRMTNRSVISHQRELDGIDRAEWIGDTPIWRVAFCPSCKELYERAQEPPK